VEAVGETIRRALKRAGTKNKFAALAVSGSSVITKVITMPGNLSEDELETQIQLEADQYIPYSLDEVTLDFEVIGASETDPERMDVLLAASRSEIVDARVAATDIAGLTCKIIDVEAFALENAFSILAQDMPTGGIGETVALVDIGSTMTALSVLIDNKIVYAREQTFGGKQLTEEIQRRYGLTYEEAGLAKRQGGLPDNYGPEVLEPFKESMSQQVNRSLQFFYSSSQVGQVDRIVLAGGCASIEGSDQVIAEKTGVEVQTANPFSRMSLANRVNAEILANDAPSLMIACGLAMRSAF
jgi:type IV pilus assembly protein PilM